MNTTLLKVTGMNGPECVRLVTNAIQDLPGIGQVELSPDGAASIEHSAMVSADDILQAIQDAGFDAA
jgi:copper chaperone